MPTLTQIRSYNTDHLVNAAPQWAAAADHWPFHTLGTANELAMMEQTGANAAATAAKVADLHGAALAASGPVLAASELAPAAASDLLALKSRVMAIVGWCLEGAYWVGDDLKLTDMFRAPTTAIYKARSQIQDWLQATLREAAGDLHAHDTAVAAAIDSHNATLAGTRGIHAVDNHTGGGLGVDPLTHDPIPDPPAGPIPPGKQWWYHVGGGWKLQDHLVPRSGEQIIGDIVGIAGGVAAAPLLPSVPSILAEINAGRAIWGITHAEGP